MLVRRSCEHKLTPLLTALISLSAANFSVDCYTAEFSQTTRGREQLIFCGQPYVYEKRVILSNGEVKRLWRCNQWWNKRCRARVYTINNRVTPLNKYHTHEDIIKRKKRTTKKKVASAAAEPEREVDAGGMSRYFIIQSNEKTDPIVDNIFPDSQ